MRRTVRAAVCAAATLLLVAPGVGAKAPAEGAANHWDVAAGRWDSYIVVLKADPLVTSFDQKQLMSPAAQQAAAQLVASHDAVLGAAGISTAKKTQDFTGVLNGFSALVDHRQAVQLAADPRVQMVIPDELRQAQQAPVAGGGIADDPGPTLQEFLGLPSGPYASGIDGSGALLGVIDTGIWPELASFADDGTYPKAPKLNSRKGRDKCDFGNHKANPNDAKFTCNNKLVGARQVLDTYRRLIGADPDEFDSARDDDGHGTHTASTAAGNANVSAVIFGREVDQTSGIAPHAQLIAYKALGNLGGFTSDLAAAIDQAVTDGVNVINYSIGGGANLASADAISFLFAERAGVYAAASAGNSGPGAETIGGPADLPWVTTVGANTQPRFYRGTITLGDGSVLYGSSITLGTGGPLPLVDAADLGNALCLPDVFEPGSLDGKIVLCQRGAIGRSEKSRHVEEAGGKAMILANTNDVDNYFTDNFRVPTVMVDGSDGEQIAAYADTAGGDATAELSDTAHISTLTSAPSTAIFSSRGPNPSAPDIIKPDVTAPGVQVLAGASPFSEPDFADGQFFQAIAGTSMSSPVVAGVYLLVKQAHPNWTAGIAKSALMTSALTDVLNNDRVSPAGPFDMGAGHVNPAGGIGANLAYPVGFYQYVAFLCGNAPGVVGASTCAALAAAGIPSKATDLNEPSIGVSALAGTATVKRTVQNLGATTTTFTASVENPAGYQVTVTPASLTLGSGQAATFTVRIDNVSAPVDEWFFGSLTWTGGGVATRSPIAVQGTAIAAPAAVRGAGVEGSVQIPVQFGYSGTYAAEASGLVAPEARTGTVAQDPDQEFGSPDDGAGVVALPVQISNDTYARWSLELPDSTGIDIDLYLENSAGDIVAQSTAGGTHELIELSYPEDGDYTLFVHGWAVPGGTTDFSIPQWLVPNVQGNLTASGPSLATLGGTATVTASWTGLTAGTQYFGAVAHTDGTNPRGVPVLAQTVVEVDA